MRPPADGREDNNPSPAERIPLPRGETSKERGHQMKWHHIYDYSYNHNYTYNHNYIYICIYIYIYIHIMYI